MNLFPINECVKRVKMTKVELKDGVSKRGANKGKKYEGITFSFVKDGAYFNGTIWAVNPDVSFFKGDIDKINQEKEMTKSKLEQIGAIYMKDNGKMVDLKSWLEDQEERNFKVFAEKFIEYLDNSDIRTTLVDLKVVPREKDGEFYPALPKFGSFIRRSGDKRVHLTYSEYEREIFLKLNN